jgi:hypothetical protein
MRILGRTERHVGFVGGGAAAGIHDDPSVGELDDARILFEHHRPAQDVGVERA